MPLPLTNAVVIITGASAGIARATAIEFARHGANVVLAARRQDRLEAVAAECRAFGHDAIAVRADVGRRDDIERVVQAALDRFGRIDVLVNNAGFGFSGTVEETTESDMRELMDVNFMGVVHSIQATLPSMKTRPYGRIVAVASTAGLKGYAYVSAYVAAKHAVVGLVRALALELATTPITVNAVCPGFTDTDLVSGSIDTIMKKTGRSREQAAAELAKHNPQGRLVTPGEVADTVLWLCGEGAGAVTGQAIAVAGGEI